MGELVTVFGGGGFLGRYVVQELLRRQARVRLAARDPRGAWFLKPLGGLGQTEFVAADIRRPDSVARAVAGAGAVVNLVGILDGDFQAIHVEGARNVAAAAAAAGAQAMVQVSAIGADPASASGYGRSKAEGEAAVRAAFPGATILRPSIVFGPEDGFVNRFARMAQAMPVVPVLKGGTRFQPIWVNDVAEAVAKAALEPDTYGGRTFELGGPETISMAELNRWIAREIGRPPRVVELPDPIGALLAAVPLSPITRDQWAMLQTDNVVAPGAEGIEAFGIVPTPLATIAPTYLVQYRRHGRFGRDAAA